MATATHAPTSFHTDPILSALDRHAETWAVLQMAPRGPEAAKAEAAMYEALNVLLVTPCATRAGAGALLRHLRWFIPAARVTNSDPLSGAMLVRAAELDMLLGGSVGADRSPGAAAVTPGLQRLAERRDHLVADWRARELTGQDLDEEEVERTHGIITGLDKAIFGTPAGSLADLAFKVRRATEFVAPTPDRHAMTPNPTLEELAWQGLAEDVERLAAGRAA